ncbi:MAG: TatD family hydrolase [Dysgonamonadaceae bacterium]|jgi:TatD DNase family protein|nr:TatD family hydrolase [Dysgonamonadaceae bacterium]
MSLIDTHTHIFLGDFDGDTGDMLLRAESAGVRRFYLPNIDCETVTALHTLCDLHPDTCFPMMGLHPCSVRGDFRGVLRDVIRPLFALRRYVAVGEIGLDFYWDTTFATEQIEAFEMQLRWSLELGLPVCVHSRLAFGQVFESLRRVGGDVLRGIFHSFGGTREELATALSFPNFMLGINGTITFKNSSLATYLTDAPLDRLVLETDAPYLSPVPFRGRRNEPSYIVHTARRLAEIYGVSFDALASATERNALLVFGGSRL